MTANRPRGPQAIYLGLLSEFTAGLDDEQAHKFMTDLTTIVANLGYRLASGTSPEFDQLWAIELSDDNTIQ